MFASLTSALQQTGLHQPGQADGLSTWSAVSNYLSEVATEAAFDLPPLQRDAGLMRMCHVLAELCHFAYISKATDVGSTTSIEVPMGTLQRAVVSARLIHFREAAVGHELDCPQQFGIWEVSGVGLVVAFRGTASAEDVFIDTNIEPVPLDATGGLRGRSAIKVHRGFYEGAKRHLEEIAAVVSERDSEAGKRLPVWVTGHSLGGGYANALALHLLANRATAQLFGAGGGTVTFGAPMVVHSEVPERLYRQLGTMERRAEASGGADAPQLQFHNLVNNADVVPRLLGTSLDVVHAVMESYVPLIKSVRAKAANYHSFGTYHFIVGSRVRTPLHGRLPEDPQSGASMPTSSSTQVYQGGVGDYAYAQEVAKQLNSSRILQTFFASNGRGGGVTHHSILSYQEKLASFLEQMAIQPRLPGSTAAAQDAPPLDPEDPCSLFKLSPTTDDGHGHAVLDELGRSAGRLGAAAAAEIGALAAQGMATRAQSYWTARTTRSASGAVTTTTERHETVTTTVGASGAATAAASTSWVSSISSWLGSGQPEQAASEDGRGRGRGRSAAAGGAPRGRGRGRGRAASQEL
ncbi:hypothetical protein COCOBI_09-2680 [Coccomyxa sp. Obi]|nr:hypothetical protein COCOBI_09-2680 [Coccomyxa sp. Obi]